MKHLTFLIAVSLTSFTALAQNTQPFKHGEKVAFLGNSITQGGNYHSYLWYYYMTHFPNRRITVFNCGIGGDVAGGMYKRLEQDIYSKHPSIIFLSFGMNDSGYREYLEANANELAEKNISRSYNDFKKVEKRFIADKTTKKVLLTSTPFDETAELASPSYPKKNDVIKKIAEFQAVSAEKNNWGFIDLLRPIDSINIAEQTKDKTYTLVGKDRIHPEVDGHLVMTYLVLKAQGLKGDDISNVSINALKKTVEQSRNCTISNLRYTDQHLTFDYLANSLPFALDTAKAHGSERRMTDALKVIPFTKEFNNEALKVKGLKKGTYQLKIAGIVIGNWSSGDLENGINLAEQSKTPQYQQARTIRFLNEERMNIEGKLRSYYWIQYMYLLDKGMLFQENRATIDTVNAEASRNIYVASHTNNFLNGFYKEVRDSWNEQMEMIVDKIYAINKPKKHRIELTYVK